MKFKRRIHLSTVGKICSVCRNPAFSHVGGKPFCSTHYGAAKRSQHKAKAEVLIELQDKLIRTLELAIREFDAKLIRIVVKAMEDWERKNRFQKKITMDKGLKIEFGLFEINEKLKIWSKLTDKNALSELKKAKYLAKRKRKNSRL